MVDVRHFASSRRFADRITRRTLSANEHDFAAFSSQLADEVSRIIEHGQGLLKVDDVNFIALTEDELAHFWIPVTGLVTEMDACFEHLAHSNFRHDKLLYGLCLHTSRQTQLVFKASTLRVVSMYVWINVKQFAEIAAALYHETLFSATGNNHKWQRHNAIKRLLSKQPTKSPKCA
jgi:hypothetical protein